jgi:hypothetical protein
MALYTACLQLFRHLAQKIFAIRQYDGKVSMQSDKKSDCAIRAQSLCGIALNFRRIAPTFQPFEVNPCQKTNPNSPF